jgi:hypothetical protein
MSNKKQYINAKVGLDFYIDSYMQMFCEKHGLTYDESYWIGGKGEVIEIGDMFINFSDVRIDLEQNCPVEMFADWYWTVLESNLPHINYASWVKGLRHKDLKA